jgi:hypothetical protein
VYTISCERINNGRSGESFIKPLFNYDKVVNMKGVTLTDYAELMIREAKDTGCWGALNPGTGEGIYPLHIRNHDSWTVTVATDKGPCDVVYGWEGETPVIRGWLIGTTEDENPVTTPIMDEFLYIHAAMAIRERTGKAPGRADLI